MAEDYTKPCPHCGAPPWDGDLGRHSYHAGDCPIVAERRAHMEQMEAKKQHYRKVLIGWGANPQSVDISAMYFAVDPAEPETSCLCKAINGATLTRLLAEIGDLERVILEPHPVTGNLVVYRLVDAETMRSIGYIDVSEETFEPWDTPTDYALPKGWRTAEREDAERWTESLVVCDKCGHRWVAVRPAGTDELECPSCHYRQLVDAS